MTARREVLTELYVDGAWTNISTDVQHSDTMSTRRGKSEYSSQAGPQSLGLTLNNASGKYSPRNPMSPYSGKIGRNTPIRVGVQVDPTYEATSSTSGTGDLSWTHHGVTPTGVLVFVWQYDTTVGQIDSVTYGGVPMSRQIFGAFVMGAFNAVGYAYWLNRDIPAGDQTVVVDTNATKTRYACAITVHGGDAAEVEFLQTAYSNATPTTNPFTTKATSKRAMIFGTLLSELDDGSTITPQAGYAQLDELDIGTETVSVTRTGVLPAATYSIGWTQTPAAHWGIMGFAVRTISYRFWGSVSSFPPKWNLNNTTQWVPIEAAGDLRRLGQGTDPAQTGLDAFIRPSADLYRYWPLAGAAGTFRSLDVAPETASPQGLEFYSEVPGGKGNFQYGTDMGSPYVGTGVAFFNSDAGPMRADIGIAAPFWAFDFVFATIPSQSGMGNFSAVFPDYSGCLWTVNFYQGIAQVSFTDPSSGPIGFSPTGVLPALRDVSPHHVRFKVLQNGANADWTLYIDGVVVDSGTQPSYVTSGLSLVRFYISRASAAEERINLAHLAFFADATSEGWPSAAAMSDAAQGYAGELAGTRIQRICALSGITLSMVGDPANTLPMGGQHSEGALTQIRDAESTDLGILTEPRDRAGLLYRTRASLYNQLPTATLTYSAKELAPPFEPVDDDSGTHNDITASRRDGDTYRLTDTTSRMSVLAPPLGVGPYKDEVTVNVQTDDQLIPVAGWLLSIGTVDEMRYPQVTVLMDSAAIQSNPALQAALLAIDVGDRLVITGASQVNIYDDVSLIVLGYSETLSPFEHSITFNCVPESPFQTFIVEDTGSRIGSGETSLTNATMTTTTNTMKILSVDLITLWVTDPAQFPISLMVAGEEMTCTAVTGTTPGVEQTATVTRSVNGVVKTHAVGEVVRLKRIARIGL